MGDATWLIAALTGGTAVLASWTTGRQSSRAARYQADLAAREGRDEETRSARRAAYTELVAQLHEMARHHGAVRAVIYLEASPGRSTELIKARDGLLSVNHTGFLPVLHRVSIEGPEDVAHAADQLRAVLTRAYKVVRDLAEGSRREENSVPPRSRYGPRRAHI